MFEGRLIFMGLFYSPLTIWKGSG